MKKLLLAFGLLSLSVTGCVQEMMDPQEEQDVRVYPEFFVEEVEPYDTGVKTSLTEDRRLVWSAGDQLAIFQGSSIADKYQVKDSADGQMNASFSIVREQAGEDDDSFAGVEVEFDTNVALYPYQSGLTCVPVYGAPVDEGEDGVVGYKITDVVFPAVQSYVPNSFAEESYMMVSVTSGKSDHTLKFKNVCGVLKLQLKGTAKVRTIELMGNADEPLSGSAIVTAYSDGTVPTVQMLSTASKTVTLDCGEGVQLNEETPAVFMIALPPTAFATGFTATLTACDGSTAQLSTAKANPVNRSKIKSMPACRVAFTPVIPDLSSAIDLSETGSANSYIVSEGGLYKFSTFKGNSSESVGAVASAEVLWESFGTDVTPNVGDLLIGARYEDGYIAFKTADTFKEGNAVIAAKDASGTILWSWHIWFTDQPEEQVYYNNAGIMMDRNLGATSATPGDVGALGLLYQWGRKDPFLGASSIHNDDMALAKSTTEWPLAVLSDSNTGTIEYATANPTTYIFSSYADWYRASSLSTDNERWTTSEASKSIYDPCPAGWRVPDGGSNGVWSKALGSSSSFTTPSIYNDTNEGINFANMFCPEQSIWYPASGCRKSSDGSLDLTGLYGIYWSVSMSNSSVDCLYLWCSDYVNPQSSHVCAGGNSVRCIKDGLASVEPEPEPEPEDYDENRYIVYNGTGRNNNTVISGDSYWDIQPFLYSRVSSINEIEMKFQMGPSSASPYDSERRWLFSSERPFVNNGARLTSEGLVLRYNNSGRNVVTNEKVITWDEMDVSPTDKIVLNISVTQKKITVNGKEISVPEIETFTSIDYLFSSYFYENDDGYAKVYETAPIGSKLYYAKIWNTSGSLLYHGYASEGEVSEGNIQPAWKSKYNGTTYLEFPNTNYQSFWVKTYTTSWPAFGEGADNGEMPSEASCLSETGTANSYIVSSAGAYQFTATKGNSSESVGEIASADVLWESYGTSSAPSKGSLVTYAKYEDGNIFFSTPDSFQEGNAVIAAKDVSGTILWSWHIWLTDQPQEHVYYNNAGTMMDRNLGATSATPGDVCALGLLYQWGRKDPFLGSSSISSDVLASSSITWPSAVSTNSTYGTVEYVTTNPTVFVSSSGTSQYDWHYSTRNDELWASDKTIYDPCPAGWRVPDGGRNSVWAIAFASPENISNHPFNDSSKGVNFSGELGGAATIWYPVVGYRNAMDNGSLSQVGRYTSYVSVTPSGSQVYPFDINFNGLIAPSFDAVHRGHGYSVRCFKEGSISSDPVEPEAVNLSDEGTANSYIVSESGAYKFSTVKGNSSERVGAVASAEVLWETFGTDVTPSVGDLIKTASYKDGEITFRTADTFREGNAVIAAKNASGTIIWSWHIWLTDEPQEHVYYNNAGTMMDRNLGATSATPGDVGALGLLYQWGRKDPFLGSSNISSNQVAAKSTITWPSAVSTSSSIGTVSYVTANPTTFVMDSSSPYDWLYSSYDNTLWTTSGKTKSIYDPCPPGWRIPDGDVWSTSLGSLSSFTDSSLYDNTNEGMNFSGRFGNASTIWYPASGFRNCLSSGSLGFVGAHGYYWSASPYSYYASCLTFDYDGYVGLSYNYDRAFGLSVRCVKDGPSSTPSEPEQPQKSYSVQLNPSTYGWVKSAGVSNPDSSLYDGVYESTNGGVSNTKSIMYIDINGYDTFTIYVRSYAESNYDYVEVSNLDADITSSTSNIKATTKGNQQSGTALSSYTAVTYTNIGGGQRRIMVTYRKDVSVDSGDDKGYLLIPKNQ